MRVFNEQIATDLDLSADQVSTFVPLKSTFMYSIAANISGVPTGTLTLEASNDPETNDTQPSTNNPTNWAFITGSTFTVTAAGTSMWNVHDVAYNYVRVRYVDASSGSSTATMNIVVNSKGV